jgi:hypothetical protein
MDSGQDQSDHQGLRDDGPPDSPVHEQVPAPARNEQAPEKEGEPDNNNGTEPEMASTWRRPDIIGLIFDGVVAVATVVGIYFLVVQSGQTEAALNEARQATLEAKESNRLTREGQERETRAWVGLQSGQFQPIKSGEPAHGTLTIINGGSSPAFNVAMTSGVLPHAQSKYVFPLKIEPKKNVVSAQAVLFAGMTVTHNFAASFPVMPVHLEDFNQGAFVFYVVGQIEYDDVFGKHRVTEFCMQVNDTGRTNFCQAQNTAK